MNPEYPVSILIPAHNEAYNLQKLLPLLQWAKEIIVIDSFSTDQTLVVAETLGAKTIQRIYDNPAAQKNYGMGYVTQPWIMLLDADEFPDDEIIKHVQIIVNKPINKKTPIAYEFLRRQYFLNKEIKYSGWQNDWIIRLIQNSNLRYTQGEVHETFDLDKKSVGRIPGILHHYTAPNLDFFIQKQIRYAKMSAKQHLLKTGRITLFHLWLKPSFRFFKHYVLKQGFRDGYRGLLLAYIMAISVRLRYIYMTELKLNNAKGKTTNQQKEDNA